MSLLTTRRTPKLDRYRATRPWGKDYWRRARCDEVACPRHIMGFEVVVPIGSDKDLYIRNAMNPMRTREGRSILHFTTKEEVGIVTFAFPPGQQCFNEHLLPIEREPIFLHKVGTQPRVMDFPDFMGEFNESAYRLQEARKRG